VDKRITIALAGNPNSGKTTIFNRLTGSRQKVGNWGGVTVEKKEGRIKHRGYNIHVVDLPGTYSLTAYSIEEIISRNYILYDKPDVVVDVIDASNLERNLYLATQFIELEAKLVFAFNMMDVAYDRGVSINTELLSELLGAPIIPTVGTTGEGIDKILDEIIRVYEKKQTVTRHTEIRYTREIEQEVAAIQDILGKDKSFSRTHPSRWVAVKLMEGDTEIQKIVRENSKGGAETLALAQDASDRINTLFHDDPEVIMADSRYGFISGALKESVKKTAWRRWDISERIDLVLTNRILGFPILFFFIWLMFQLTFRLGQYPMDWIETGVGWLSDFILHTFPPSVITDLIANGIIPGVGGVAIFIPNIFILFFVISLFEDTGYMARAAFIMDKVMHSLGLHGKSFIPMMMGFGCNVPAIMATRTLENHQDRILTILINPLISCSARLPVYILLAGTFFPKQAGNAIFSIYIIGIVLAFLLGRFFKKTLFRSQEAPFVMELPPYRMPTLRGTLIHMWERGSMFIRKMGTIILVGSVIVWFLSSFPAGTKTPPTTGDIAGETMTEDISLPEQETYLEAIGHATAPVFAPLNFPWEASVALISGFVAKEIVVSTFGILYGAEGSTSIGSSMMGSGWTPLVAYAFMIFVLLYTPCLATVAAIRRETGSTKWAAFSVSYSLVLAWVIAFAIVRVGTMLGYG
jgi:ferrous iron transport protein B